MLPHPMLSIDFIPHKSAPRPPPQLSPPGSAPGTPPAPATTRYLRDPRNRNSPSGTKPGKSASNDADLPGSPGPRPEVQAAFSAAASTIFVDAQFRITDAMPLSRPASDVYISLLPMTCLLAASSTK